MTHSLCLKECKPACRAYGLAAVAFALRCHPAFRPTEQNGIFFQPANTRAWPDNISPVEVQRAASATRQPAAKPLTPHQLFTRGQLVKAHFPQRKLGVGGYITAVVTRELKPGLSSSPRKHTKKKKKGGGASPVFIFQTEKFTTTRNQQATQETCLSGMWFQGAMMHSPSIWIQWSTPLSTAQHTKQ